MTSPPLTHFVGPFAFLSNFYEAPFKADGIEWPTVEHFFQAHKVLVKGDPKKNLSFRRIVQAKTPREAKALGRSATLRPNWDEIKLGVMRRALTLKFGQNDRLAMRLMMTGERPLIEGNTWGDRYWGATCHVKGSAHTHVGQNWLGHLLMAERSIQRARR